MNMTVHDFPTASLNDATRCVMLGLQGCALVLAQTEVLALESVLDMQPAPRELRNASGVLQLGSGECGVYSLDSDLQPLSMLPPPHRICAVLNHARGQYALSCAEVRMLERSALELHPLPRAFTARSGPLRTLVVMEGRLLLGSTAAALWSHLAQPQQAEVIAFAARARKVRS